LTEHPALFSGFYFFPNIQAIASFRAMRNGFLFPEFGGNFTDRFPLQLFLVSTQRQRHSLPVPQFNVYS